MREISGTPKIEKIEKPENDCFKKIKPESGITAKEARNFIEDLFNKLEKKNNEGISAKDNPEMKVPSARQNKLDGCRRETEVAKDLGLRYPEKEWYKVLREKELCDRGGKPVMDLQTGEKRRIDFVVVKDGKVVDMVEVTSKTASKRDQLAKEYRIRDNGGNYVREYDDNGMRRIYRIPNNVETRVERSE